MISAMSFALAVLGPLFTGDTDTANPREDAEVFAIGEQLRCPVCQGMPIAESPSSMAQDMMQRVRQMKAQGRSREEIVSYFVARYGEWVLLSPRTSGFSLIVWIIPPLTLILGTGIWWRWLRRHRSLRVPTGRRPASCGPLDDEYLREIRREVEE
jgi:cytochrome c-type biogenesis protein CcmH